MLLVDDEDFVVLNAVFGIDADWDSLIREEGGGRVLFSALTFIDYDIDFDAAFVSNQEGAGDWFAGEAVGEDVDAAFGGCYGLQNQFLGSAVGREANFDAGGGRDVGAGVPCSGNLAYDGFAGIGGLGED